MYTLTPETLEAIVNTLNGRGHCAILLNQVADYLKNAGLIAGNDCQYCIALDARPILPDNLIDLLLPIVNGDADSADLRDWLSFYNYIIEDIHWVST